LSGPEQRELLEILQKKADLSTKEDCERSFHEFVKEAFSVLHPGQVIKDNWHVKEICDILEVEIRRIHEGRPKTKDIIINVPPRSLKSFVTTICLPAWAWTLDARIKFIGSSYSDDLSTDHNVMTRRLVESDWYQQFWGDTVQIASDQNQKRKFETTEGGLRRCTSTGGTITGSGGDVIIVDDPVNPMQAASEKERDSANKYFDETLTTRLNNPETGLFIVIMQRLHEEDLTGHLLKKNPDAYQHICIPARLSDNVKPASLRKHYVDGLFFPGRFTDVVLTAWEKSLGSYGASGQLAQLPSPAEGGIIKKAWFEKISYTEFQTHVLRKVYLCDVFIDSAYTEKSLNDPSALMATFYCNKLLYILNSDTVWKELPELIDYVPSYIGQHQLKPKTAIRIEPKASGKSLKQTLKKNGLNAIELPPPEVDKIARVTNATPFMEAGRCILVEGPWNDSFLNECGAFPNAAHDDQVDNLTNAINHYENRPYKPF
jgi:predicted phage terminase large subunit-like protein